MSCSMRFRWKLKCLCVLVAAACSLAQGASVRFMTIDATTRQPVACRMHLQDPAKKPVQPKGLPFWKDHFVCVGEAELELAQGSYTYEIDRGPEYFLIRGTFSVTDNGSRSITNRLR